MRHTILLIITLSLTACAPHRGTLFLDKTPSSTAALNYHGVLTPKEQARVIRSLEQTTAQPVIVVGKDKSINSYREFCKVLDIPFPSVLTEYNVTAGPAQEGMDYKDVWLNQGPPVAIFVTEDFVTWRYKNDRLVVFVEGQTVRVSR